MSDSCRLMRICGHVGCVSAEESDGAMTKNKSPRKSPFSTQISPLVFPNLTNLNGWKMGIFFHYLMWVGWVGWVGWENVWRWCWQSDCEYIGLLPLPRYGVSVITFIGKTQHWWSGGAEGEHCYGFCKEIQTCQSHKVSQNCLLNYPLKKILLKTQKCSRNPCPLLLDKHTCWDLML